MAKVASRFIQLVHVLLFVNSALTQVDKDLSPEFSFLKVTKVDENTTVIENADYHKVFFEVQGRNIDKTLQIKTTSVASQKNTLCKEDLKFVRISDVRTTGETSASYVALVPKSVTGKVYVCLPHGTGTGKDGTVPSTVFNAEQYKWYHQGENVFFEIPKKVENSSKIDLQNRNRRTGTEEEEKDLPRVYGIRVEIAHRNELGVDDHGVPEILTGFNQSIRIFGENFRPDMTITFTTEALAFGVPCQMLLNKGFQVISKDSNPHTMVFYVNLEPVPSGASAYYVCVKTSGNDSSAFFLHQGTETYLQMKTYSNLPLWAAIMIILLCLCVSALFSGLNLGLMALDKTELKIVANTGTPKERQYAKTIAPVRAHGNYLLCTILLSNVMVNNIFTILLDQLTSGTIAVIFSTLAIVCLGEITPQAICSRYGLAISAHTIWIMKFMMLLTFPLAYPVSKFLNWLLGEELGNVYTRERLKELVKVTTDVNELDKDEVNIISGALELRKKTVSNVMTKIEDVFMLDYEAILDFETVSEIMKSGFSRVPVFEGTRQNIVTMLYIKDLAFVDPDDNTPLKTLCQFYQNPCNFVFEDVTLDVIFKIFKEGNKGHMAFVHRVNNEGEGDPFYETVGLITLEDVIEELIQAEIMDETDVFTDNRSKRKRIADRTKQDFSAFAERRGESNRIRISPQLTLAAFQYMSTSVEPFLPHVISETILRRLLKQDIVYHVKKTKTWRTDPANIIYQQGKAVDYFVLILEGRVEVTVGKENLTFEGGPFTYFGTQALSASIGVAESPSVPASTLGSLESINLDSILRHSFHPDYTVRACTEVLYLHIKRSLYMAAKRATLMEKSQKGGDHNQAGEQFDEEVDKLLHSFQEDGSIGLSTPRKTSRNLGHSNPDNNDSGSRNISPKAPYLYANVSPSQNAANLKDLNGAIRLRDNENSEKEEEESLLAHNKS